MLGSSRQKSTCFHALLAYIRNNKPAKETSNISFRDVFAKDKLPDVKKLVQRGLELKKSCKIACFKVRSRGQDGIPVLEIRKWTSDKQRGSWQVYEDSDVQQEEEMVMTTQRNQATEGLLPASTADQQEMSQKDLSPSTIQASSLSESTAVQQEMHAKYLSPSTCQNSTLVASTAVLQKVPQKEWSPSTGSETSYLDSDTDNDPLYDLPHNFIKKLPKVARDWKISSKLPPKTSTKKASLFHKK
jgi:hypothetical protein